MGASSVLVKFEDAPERGNFSSKRQARKTANSEFLFHEIFLGRYPSRVSLERGKLASPNRVKKFNDAERMNKDEMRVARRSSRFLREHPRCLQRISPSNVRHATLS